MKDWLILFLKSILIVFAGFVLCNICALTIDCVFDGFDSFFERVWDLPYIMYACFSAAISIIFTITVANKRK